MEQTVTVLRLLSENMALVRHERQSACSGDCHKCAGCGAAKETLEFPARNPLGAKPGDKVVVSAQSGPVLTAAAVLCALPLVLFFGLYALGLAVGISPAGLGCAGFGLGLAAAVLYGKRLEKKKKTDYTITAFAR